MFTKRLLEAALATAMIVTVSVANAGPLPLFTIIGGTPEATGDANGTVYPWPGGPGVGAGSPSTDAGWPNTGPGLAPEPGFGLGTSGFDFSYLQLNAPTDVTFQFMGGGHSSQLNSFWLFYNDGTGGGPAWHQLFQDSHSGNPTDPCPVGPVSTVPACDKVAPGIVASPTFEYNQYTIFLDPTTFPGPPNGGGPGLIPFLFDVNQGFDLNVAHDDGVHNATNPGFFLGIDPYAPFASGQFQRTGNAVYAGLTDLSGGDHDFQDMDVRISVPEPGSLLLLGAGLMALAGLRRRKA